MKTPTVISKPNFLNEGVNNKTHYEWRRLGSFLRMVMCGLPYCLPEGQSLGAYFSSGARMIWAGIRVHAAQVPHAFLAWIKALANCAINNRIYAGLGLVVIVAPVSACIHMLPGMKELVSQDWFYKNYYNLYLVLGPYFFCLCIVMTAFLWIPPTVKRIKFSKKALSFQITRALSIPFGLIVGKIVWLIFCDSNEDFELLGNPLFFLGGVIISYIAFRVLEYSVWRQEHAMNAIINSLEGLYNTPGFTEEQRRELSAPYWKELREFHSKY